MFKKLFSWRRKPPAAAVKMDAVSAETAEPLALPVAQWQVTHHSVRGVTHVAKDMPNQDYVESWREDQESLPLLLAIADGHGSITCPRSDVGARLAVQTAISCARELLSSGNQDRSKVKQAWENELPRQLERRWKQAVEEHLAAQPLRVAEVAPLEKEKGTSARKRVEAKPVLAYGATVLLIALNETYWACLQLGDGEFVVVDDEALALSPMETDARLMANETTSLCGDEAWQDVRTRFQAIDGRPPALLLAATDGYANAFETAEGFLAVGPDLLQLLAQDGEEAVRTEIPSWLEEASREGSGDDVTLGIIWRVSAVAECRERLSTKTREAEDPQPAADVDSSVSVDT